MFNLTFLLIGSDIYYKCLFLFLFVTYILVLTDICNKCYFIFILVTIIKETKKKKRKKI